MMTSGTYAFLTDHYASGTLEDAHRRGPVSPTTTCVSAAPNARARRSSTWSTSASRGHLDAPHVRAREPASGAARRGVAARVHAALRAGLGGATHRLVERDDAWWAGETSFFGVPRSRAWVLVRRIAHTAHHRGQLTVLLRLRGRAVCLDVTVPRLTRAAWSANEAPTPSDRAAHRRGAARRRRREAIPALLRGSEANPRVSGRDGECPPWGLALKEGSRRGDDGRVRQRGSHRQFQHPELSGTVALSATARPGTFKSIARQAVWGR
jgi:hypothetical protein